MPSDLSLSLGNIQQVQTQTLVPRYFFFYWHPSTFHGLKCYKSDGNVYLIKVPQCKISIFSENHSPLILSQSCLDTSNISPQLKTWLIKNYDGGLNWTVCFGFNHIFMACNFLLLWGYSLLIRMFDIQWKKYSFKINDVFSLSTSVKFANVETCKKRTFLN